jgi:hypothetical protein
MHGLLTNKFRYLCVNKYLLKKILDVPKRYNNHVGKYNYVIFSKKTFDVYLIEYLCKIVGYLKSSYVN